MNGTATLRIFIFQYFNHEKSREVCIKARSPPASLAIIGQVTRHTTVKWPTHGITSEARITSWLRQTNPVFLLKHLWNENFACIPCISHRTRSCWLRHAGNSMIYIRYWNMFYKRKQNDPGFLTAPLRNSRHTYRLLKQEHLVFPYKRVLSANTSDKKGGLTFI